MPTAPPRPCACGAAATIAREGRDAATAVIGSMNQIDASARPGGRHRHRHRVDHIPDHHLVLNAAVELARAGERERGFGVVASEARGPAQRSASAAGDIGVLIRRSGAEVAAGSGQARGAG